MNKRFSVAVTTRMLLPGEIEGIGLFTSETMKRIVHAHPEIDFWFLFDRPYDSKYVFADNVRPVVIRPPARHPVLWWWWYERSVAGWLRRNNPDLLISPDGYACRHTRIPQLMVIHDLAFEHFRKNISASRNFFLRRYTPMYARHVARIATVSEYSKHDIVERYNISPDNIDVVYNGSVEHYAPIAVDRQQQVRNEYTDGKPYFIYIGSIHPRKNLVNLLRAYDTFRQATASDIQLIIVGRKAWSFDDVERVHSTMKYRDSVRFLGSVPIEALSQLLASAFALTYIPVFEGFGIPILEAWSSGIPVITSNATSTLEIGQDAALLVDPYSVDSIADAMKQYVFDEELRRQMIVRGSEKLKQFNWDRTARLLWESCMRAWRETGKTM